MDNGLASPGWGDGMATAPRRAGRRVVALLGTLVVASCVGPAHAEVTARLGADATLLINPVEPGTETAPGLGITGLVGYSPELEPLILVPEIGGSFHWFDDRYGRMLTRAVAGARLGVAAAVEPSLSLHLGYARTWGHDVDAVLAPDGFTLDTIVACDFRLERWLSLGPQIGYLTVLAPTDRDTHTFHVVSLGAGVTGWF